MAVTKIDVSDSTPSEGRAEDLLMIPAPWDVSEYSYHSNGPCIY